MRICRPGISTKMFLLRISTIYQGCTQEGVSTLLISFERKYYGKNPYLLLHTRTRINGGSIKTSFTPGLEENFAWLFTKPCYAVLTISTGQYSFRRLVPLGQKGKCRAPILTVPTGDTRERARALGI